MQPRGLSRHLKLKVPCSTACTLFLLHPFPTGNRSTFYHGSRFRSAASKYPSQCTEEAQFHRLATQWILPAFLMSD